MFLRVILILLTFIGVGFQFFYYRNMPQIVASHFGINGLPDNWMSGRIFLFISVILISGISVLMAVSPLIAGKNPACLKIPNKEYWIRNYGIEFIINILMPRMLILGILTVTFLISVFYLVYTANISTSVVLNIRCFAILLLCYIVCVTVWSTEMFNNFKKNR